MSKNSGYGHRIDEEGNSVPVVSRLGLDPYGEGERYRVEIKPEPGGPMIFRGEWRGQWVEGEGPDRDPLRGPQEAASLFVDTEASQAKGEPSTISGIGLKDGDWMDRVSEPGQPWEENLVERPFTVAEAADWVVYISETTQGNLRATLFFGDNGVPSVQVSGSWEYPADARTVAGHRENPKGFPMDGKYISVMFNRRLYTATQAEALLSSVQALDKWAFGLLEEQREEQVEAAETEAEPALRGPKPEPAPGGQYTFLSSGWEFVRHEDGSVRVTTPPGYGYGQSARFSVPQWASIVARLSRFGRYPELEAELTAQVLKFHNSEEATAPTSATMQDATLDPQVFFLIYKHDAAEKWRVVSEVFYSTSHASAYAEEAFTGAQVSYMVVGSGGGHGGGPTPYDLRPGNTLKSEVLPLFDFFGQVNPVSPEEYLAASAPQQTTVEEKSPYTAPVYFIVYKHNRDRKWQVFPEPAFDKDQARALVREYIESLDRGQVSWVIVPSSPEYNGPSFAATS